MPRCGLRTAAHAWQKTLCRTAFDTRSAGFRTVVDVADDQWCPRGTKASEPAGLGETHESRRNHHGYQ